IEEGDVFENTGEQEITVTTTETDDQTAQFKVEVLDAELEKLDIRREPLKTQYFIGEDLDLSGMSVYAIYDDGAEVKLMANDYNVSDFDSQVLGDQEIVITHKDKSTTLKLHV